MIQDRIIIDDNKEAVVGMRYNDNSLFADKLSYSFAYKYLTNKYIFRMSIGVGYRTPNLKELYYNWEATMNHPIAVYGDPNLKAEDSKYVSLSFGKRKINNFNVEFYMNNIDNMIEYQDYGVQ